MNRLKIVISFCLGIAVAALSLFFFAGVDAFNGESSETGIRFQKSFSGMDGGHFVFCGESITPNKLLCLVSFSGSDSIWEAFLVDHSYPVEDWFERLQDFDGQNFYTTSGDRIAVTYLRGE